MTAKIQKFKQIVREIVLLDNTRNLLQWDQETYMPPLAGLGRGKQTAQLTEMIHQRSTAEGYGELLSELWAGKDQLSQTDQDFLRVKKRSYDLETRLPTELVRQIAETASLAQQAWVRAKAEDDFNVFRPHLEKVVELNKSKAEALNPGLKAYDVLLDTFEEGLTMGKVDQVFAAIVPVTQEIVQKYGAQKAPELSKNSFDTGSQKEFSRFLLEQIGYDFEQGSLDEVAHPFMIRLGSQDIRVTNSYSAKHLSSLFSALHEGGHALFEQGFSQDYADLLTDDERSLAVHESQSRFWENIIGRSSQFWAKYYPKLQQEFDLEDSLEEFLDYINFVQPSPIRTEADEVTYNLHIFIRYELEKALLAGQLQVKDVPEAWRAKYLEYLGVQPLSDREGCLQDVHWSHATLGYFPTYTLGNLISAQLWRSYQQQNLDYEQTLEGGRWPSILAWLKENVHEFGPLEITEDILHRVTGEGLNPKYFVEYLRWKYLG